MWQLFIIEKHKKFNIDDIMLLDLKTGHNFTMCKSGGGFAVYFDAGAHYVQMYTSKHVEGCVDWIIGQAELIAQSWVDEICVKNRDEDDWIHVVQDMTKEIMKEILCIN